MKKRDSLVAKLANALIVTFASEQYNEQLRKVIRIGMLVLDEAVKQEKITPNQPYGIQVGFNGHEAVQTVTPYPRESDEKI